MRLCNPLEIYCSDGAAESTCSFYCRSFTAERLDILSQQLLFWKGRCLSNCHCWGAIVRPVTKCLRDHLVYLSYLPTRCGAALKGNIGKCLKCEITGGPHQSLFSGRRFHSTFGPGDCCRRPSAHQQPLDRRFSRPSFRSASMLPNQPVGLAGFK